MIPLAVHGFQGDGPLAARLAAALGCPYGEVTVHRFPDGELLPVVPDAAETLIICRSLAHGPESLLTLILAADAWRRAGVRRLVLVAPYLAYMRQDMVFHPGQPVSQRVMGDLLGPRFDRIITVDAHLHRTPRIEDVFPACPEPLDLSVAPALLDWLRAHPPAPDTVMVGPDLESERWVRPVAEGLNLQSQIMTKTRRGDRDVSLVLSDPGQVAGRPVLLIDDVCSSGGTLIGAIGQLRQAGASAISVFITHALFDTSTEQAIARAGAGDLFSADGLAHPTNRIPLAWLLAAALAGEKA